ncbi:MAG TPA: TIGR00645 family protein [Rhizomicrobium sp.]|nr:TIGR00645 family protein [Rhizomicrobium sp.]
MHQRNAIEKVLEAVLFKSRWLLAPFYLGLVLSLLLLLGAFVAELIHVMPQLADLTNIDPEQMILAVLSLIDLSLAGNLVVIVVFSGYENFVSKINTENAEDRPSWMGTLDFSGLKMKLIGSIVAISAISLLRAFMELNEEGSVMDEARLRWMLILHMAFVGSGLLFAVMDYIGNRAEKPSEH